jgi:Short C-terminal domain
MNGAVERRPGRRRTDLLVRPPAGARNGDADWTTTLVSDPVAQLQQLADLCQRGLISANEFEREKAKILAP